MNVGKAVGWRKLRFRFDWTLTLSALTVALIAIGATHIAGNNNFRARGCCG